LLTISKVEKSQRAEAGMIIDPVTLPLNSTVGDAKALMKEHSIGGMVVNENGDFKRCNQQRFAFEKLNSRSILNCDGR
jgi:IMP dehydrogenase